MERYAILLGYYDKQLLFLDRLFKEISAVDLTVYEKRYLFAAKTQQFYTAIEDLFKQIAKAFENHIDDTTCFHKEILMRLFTEVPKIRPAAISKTSYLLLDKLRSFRHFFRHAYDCELIEKELLQIQERLIEEYPQLREDLLHFQKYVQKLI